jgi:beta-mannosidase
MGTLYWQLNDCWPVTSWSGLDYYGRWKALHYHVKRAYEPIMISFRAGDGNLYAFAVNDYPVDRDVSLEVKWMDYSGKIIDTYKDDITLPALTSEFVYASDFVFSHDSKVKGNPVNTFLCARLFSSDSLLSSSFAYFSDRNRNLPDPGLTWEINDGKITIKTEKLARQVFLEARGLKGRFSDNFFDMAPGEARLIQFVGEVNTNDLTNRLEIKTIYDTYN